MRRNRIASDYDKANVRCRPDLGARLRGRLAGLLAGGRAPESAPAGEPEDVDRTGSRPQLAQAVGDGRGRDRAGLARCRKRLVAEREACRQR
jgi:hypothetical protein